MSDNKNSFWSFKWLAEFFQDSRKSLSVFTFVSLASGCTLVFIALEEVKRKGSAQIEIIYSLFFIYCVSVISDNLLSMIIERGIWKTPPAPDTQVLADVTTDNLNLTPVNITTSQTPTSETENTDSVPPPDLSKEE